MAEKDYSPLSTACVRALNDKLYEKRKAGALEIEKLVLSSERLGEYADLRMDGQRVKCG